MKTSAALTLLVLSLSAFGCDDADGGDNPGDCPNGVYSGDLDIVSQSDFGELEGFTDVGGYFQLSCEECTVIERLECLEMVYDATIIVYNHALTDLQGLESLRETNESVQISTNNSLQNLHGLEGLEYVGGPLFITLNDSLETLDGLDSLTSVNGFIQITDNPNLGYCQICDLVEQVGGEYATTVANNNKVDECWSTENHEIWCY